MAISTDFNFGIAKDWRDLGLEDEPYAITCTASASTANYTLDDLYNHVKYIPKPEFEDV